MNLIKAVCGNCDGDEFVCSGCGVRMEALLAPQPAVDREALIATLHKAGAYCGNCNYEDWELCEDCLKVLGFYADAVLALINGTAK
jgi:hypothetical protein